MISNSLNYGKFSLEWKLILFCLKIIMMKSDYEIMISDVTDELIEKLFNSVKNTFQNNLQSMRVSAFVLDHFQLLYYKCHKINLNCGGSYIDSPDWIKRNNKSYQ